MFPNNEIMTEIEKEPEMPLTLGQLVKMTAPIVIFGVTLPLVDMITDLRMIIRLYVGVPRCAVKETLLPLYNSTCFKSDDIGTYCQENPGECSTEQHPIFASMLLGKLIMMLLGRIGE